MVKPRETEIEEEIDRRQIREGSVGVLENSGDPESTDDGVPEVTGENCQEKAAEEDEEEHSGGRIRKSVPKEKQKTEVKVSNRSGPKSTEICKEDQKFRKISMYIGGIALLIPFVICCVLCYNGGQAEKITKIEELNKNLLKLKQQFPNQEKTVWSTMFTQIKYVIVSEPQRPAILLLMHNNSELTAQCLAWQVANEASKLFEKDNFIEIIGDKINYENNELIKHYKEPLEHKAVMVVHKLHKIEARNVKGFHAFCDYYNPLVKRAVIIFTLDESVLNENENDMPNKRASNVMKSLWSAELMDSTLNSLITRISENIIVIKQEKNIKCPNS